MSKGGYINAIGTWTVDTKQSVDEYLAFISSAGQVFVYQGTDPTSALYIWLWLVFTISALLLAVVVSCVFRAIYGLLRMDGVIPMTEMLAIDRSDAPRVALTSMIMNAMNQAVQNYSGIFGWQFISYPRGTLAILNIPLVASQQAMQFVMNTITGAWCRFTQYRCAMLGTIQRLALFRVYRWQGL